MDKIIKDFDKKNMINKKYIKNYIEFQIEELKLYAFLNDLYFKNNQPTHYNIKDKTMNINLEQLTGFVDNYYQFKNEYFKKKSLILVLINHEIVHLKQQKIILEDNELSNVLKISDSYIEEFYNTIYVTNHGNFIIEYNAHVEGMINTINFVKNSKDYHLIDYKILKNFLLKSYKDNLSPIEKQADILGKSMIEIPKMDEYNNVLYGFPINANTRNKIKKMR